MVPHSSTLAWKIPRTEEPGRLQPMGSRRFGHDWATSLPFHQRPDWYLKRMFPSYVLSQLLIYLLQSSLPGILLICLLELVAWMVKNLPAMQETWVWSQGQEEPLEKRMAYPLQYSCLENSMERGAWWAKSQVQLSDFQTHIFLWNLGEPKWYKMKSTFANAQNLSSCTQFDKDT